MTVSQRILRAAIGTVIAGAVAASVWAANVSINGTTYSCTGGTVAGDGTINYTGCDGGTSTSGTSTSGTSTSGTSTSGTSTSGTSTSGTSTSGTSGAANDPGMFTGTWIPEGMTNVWVVDQSETSGGGTVTQIPGCANQKPQINGCTSSLVETKAGVTTTVTLAQGHTMSVRFLSESTIPSGYFKLQSGTGAGTPASVQFSLSQTPGDFTGPAACNKVTTQAGLQPTISIGATGSVCVVSPNTYYYLNVKTTSACDGATCKFKILEPAYMSN
ncbi:MAG: hypothetical protein K1X67_18870 [Fimbriimonadaceae bacterium]|nr:hypothetical protein [Fimbriimonadaceae bacterium]